MHDPSTLFRHLRSKFRYLFFLLILGFSPLCSLSAEPLRVHFLDIGQGDSALIESPSGKWILLDSGPSKSWKSLSAYLDRLKIKQIDLMINSHPHADHIGNAARIINRYSVKAIVDSGFAHPIRAYRDFLEAVKEKDIPLRLGRLGRKIHIGGGAEIELLAPEDPLIKHSRSDANSNSIVFRLTYKDQAALFTGDAEEETEARLMKHHKRLRADLLKVAHHGSKHASGRAFLNAVKPKHAVVSCSESNRYGHPSPETLLALKRIEAQPWVTATSGTIIAETDGERWILKASERQPTVNKVENQAKTTKHYRLNALKPSPSKSGASHEGKINVNTASLIELQSLPRIGPTLGKRIINARKEQRFNSPEDLRRVRGIGAKTAQNLDPLITY